mgnify:CR=1 FL=1
MGRFEFVVEYGSTSRRDAETQRGLLSVAFSLRLCASAGESFSLWLRGVPASPRHQGPQSEDEG